MRASTLSLVVPGGHVCPGLLRAALQVTLLPVPLRVVAQELVGVEWRAVGAPIPRPQVHLGDIGGAGDLRVDGAERCKRRQTTVLTRVFVRIPAGFAGRRAGV